MNKAGTIGFIGLGQMGFGMAGNLVTAGYDVLAYDIAPQPLERFVARGGRSARDIAQIGRECQRVMLIVVNGEQVASVVCGDDGLLQTMSGGTIMVSSTIALSESRTGRARRLFLLSHTLGASTSHPCEQTASSKLNVGCVLRFRDVVFMFLLCAADLPRD